MREYAVNKVWAASTHDLILIMLSSFFESIVLEVSD